MSAEERSTLPCVFCHWKGGRSLCSAPGLLESQTSKKHCWVLIAMKRFVSLIVCWILWDPQTRGNAISQLRDCLCLGFHILCRGCLEQQAWEILVLSLSSRWLSTATTSRRSYGLCFTKSAVITSNISNYSIPHLERINGATSMYWFIMAPHKSPPFGSGWLAIDPFTFSRQAGMEPTFGCAKLMLNAGC